MVRKLIYALLVVLIAGAGVVTAVSATGASSPWFSNLAQAVIPQTAVKEMAEAGKFDAALQAVADLDAPDIEALTEGDEWVEGDKYIPDIDPYCDGTITTQNPIALKLSEVFGVTYEDIMGWRCQGWGFGEIVIAYTISKDSGVPVADLFAMREAGKGWGEILKELGYENGEFPKPVIVPLEGKRWCEGDSPHPLAEKIAEKWGLTLDDISQWLCSGVSQADLEQAIRQAGERGVAIDEILKLRQEGRDWSEIIKLYENLPLPLRPNHLNRPDRPGRNP